MNTALRKQIARLAVNVADSRLSYSEAQRLISDAVKEFGRGNGSSELLKEALHDFDGALHQINATARWIDAPRDSEDSAMFYLRATLEELGYLLD